MKQFIKDNRFFIYSYLLSLFISILLLVFYSKAELHTAINSWHSPFFDTFFKQITFCGNGLMYLLLFVYLMGTRKYKWIIAFITAVVTSVGVVLFFKHFLFADACRPVKYFEMIPDFKLHLVNGVRISRFHSFPSGHTTTAFTVFFTLSVVIKRNGMKLLCFILALLVAYSRLYLSQHFLIDVVAGSIIAMVSAIWALHYSTFLSFAFDRIFFRFSAKGRQIFWKFNYKNK